MNCRDCLCILIVALGSEVPIGQRIAIAAPMEVKQNITVDETLTLLSSAIDAVSSFDLRVHSRTSWPLKDVVETWKTDPYTRRKVPDKWHFEVATAEELDAGTVLHHYREVFRDDERIRFEWLNSDATVEQVRVFDGEVVRSVWPTTREGGISVPEWKYVQLGFGYLECFARFSANNPILDICRARRSVVKSIPQNELLPGTVGIQVDPKPMTNFAETAYRVWLDLSHGGLPHTIEHGRVLDDRFTPQTRISIESWHRLPNGVDVPTRFKWQGIVSEGPYAGRSSVEGLIEVDLERSRWNIPLEDDLFILPFPAGYRINDQVRHIVFTAGEGDTGHSLDALVQQARGKIMKNPPRQFAPPVPSLQSKLTRWALYALPVVGALLCFLWYRLRLARAA